MPVSGSTLFSPPARVLAWVSTPCRPPLPDVYLVPMPPPTSVHAWVSTPCAPLPWLPGVWLVPCLLLNNSAPLPCPSGESVEAAQHTTPGDPGPTALPWLSLTLPGLAGFRFHRGPGLRPASPSQAPWCGLMSLPQLRLIFFFIEFFYFSTHEFLLLFVY